MANPFEVRPVNFLQALLAGEQGYETAHKRTEENALQQLFQNVGAQVQKDGNISNATLGQVISGGPKAAPLLAAIGALGKADTTDELKEYKFDMAQKRAKGLPEQSFGDWKTALKLAGATKINNSVNTGDNAFAKTVGEGEGKTYLELQKTGRSSIDQLNSLQIMENAMKDPNFYSGAGGENAVLPIKRAIAAFGGDPNSAASMETFRAHANKAVLDSMGGSLGSGFSNADRDFVVSQVPGLANTPEGNKTLIDVSRKVAARKLEIAKMAREYAKNNGGKIDGGFDEALSQWSEKNPLFPRMSSPAAPAAPSNRTQGGVQWRVVQ